MLRQTTLIALGMFLGTASGPPTSPEWLAGCWRRERGKTIVEEQWSLPRGGTMLGTSRTVRGDSTVEYEFLMLRLRADDWAYEAHPSGQEPATFRTAGLPTGDEVLFSNPAHDYPQQIGYRRVGRDSILAWIDGSVGGEVRRVEFPFARVSCTPAHR
jgi:hypothetical protein